MDKHYKVSFCITCKGRLSHLRETLPHNLKNNADYPDTEFVILDYDSQDGLEKWVKDNFREELDSGRIRYAKYTPAPYFKMAHAKNMAHRLATGEILCNLDADNITAPGFAKWLNEEFSKRSDTYVKPPSNTIQRRLMGYARSQRGLSGRIAMLKNDFYALNGYDERYTGHKKDDHNLAYRARHILGLKFQPLCDEMLGGALQHSDEARIENMQPADQHEFRDIRIKAKQTCFGGAVPIGRLYKLGHYMRLNHEDKLPANPDGRFGEIEKGATLRDQDNKEVFLPPLSPAKETPPQAVHAARYQLGLNSGLAIPRK